MSGIERRRVSHRKSGKSRVKESQRDQADINMMMRKYIAHGTPVPVVGQEPAYGDFSAGVDFHTALNKVQQAEADFAALPAVIRKHVDNDPGKFLDLVMTPEGRAELEAAGMETTRAPAAAPPPAEEAVETAEAPPSEPV